MSNDIIVIAEHLKGSLDDVTFELLGKGRELAGATGGSLVAVLMGHDMKALANQMGQADKVVCSEHESLAEFNPEAYGKTLHEIVKSLGPKVVLIPNTSMGMDLAAGLSVDLDMPLVAYASDIIVDGEKLTVTSQLYGGKMNVESVLEGDNCIVSVIAGSFSAEAGKGDGTPQVDDVAVPESVGDNRVRFQHLIEPAGGDVDITQQDILVSVGRGIQNEDNIPIVQELADALGGALSSSRPIVDNKWLPKTRQVGKSGVKVKPKLYFTVGISGAPEHIEGMKDAELIIAINTDPKAPIFDYAHYGTTEDLFDIVPALTEKLKG